MAYPLEATATELLRITREHWAGDGPQAPNPSDNPMVRRAMELLENEFLDALTRGPDTLLSVPDTARAHQAKLIDVVRSLFILPGPWLTLLGEFSKTDGCPRVAMARIYAQWVVDTYQGGFDGHVHRIAQARHHKPLPPDV